MQSDKKRTCLFRRRIRICWCIPLYDGSAFCQQIKYDIAVKKEALDYKITVLSILPLLDNVVVHNRIDSDHKMTISISLNEENELVVTNPIYPKLTTPITNGTGLQNLANRWELLMDKPLRIENKGVLFSVYLPLN